VSAQIPINTIQNSCIVNNANIAVQNVPNPQGTLTPLDATNNWWGMPKGASDQNRAGGDWVGWNITTQPHLTIIPQNCDLSNANWIPFNEQELQFAINTNLPYLNGLDFALVDIQKGIGAKFTLVAKPIYGGATGEAYITITPSPDGSFMRIMLDILQLPSDENLSKIATCELMPLFMNSLQQVQNKFTQPSQLIEQMVVMDSSLMMLFSPPTEITPDPVPEIVMNYDSACLLSLATSTPAPTPSTVPTQDESESLIQIPPMEGEIGLMENNITLQQTTPIFLNVDTYVDDSSAQKQVCDDNALDDCSLRGAIQIAYDNPTQHYAISIPAGAYRLSATLVIKGIVTLIGSGATSLILRDNTLDPIIRFTLLDASQADLAIYNLFVSGGRAFGPSGLSIHGSHVRIYNSRFENNVGDVWGGAISVVDEPIYTPSVVYIANTVFSNNQAYQGGAILGYKGNGEITIACSTLQYNHARFGGGIATFDDSTTIFSGEINISESNIIGNTPIEYGGAAYRPDVNGSIQFDGNYWSPAPSDPTLPNTNTLYNVPVDNNPQNNPLPLNCEVPPPPGQCSDPNDFSKLTEENTDLADREACWLRYADIIYLTIYHEFSMDDKLVFTPKTISDTTSFDIRQYEYDGLVGDIPLDSRHITNAELIPLRAYDSPYNPYYTFARALLNGMRNVVNPNALINPGQIPTPQNTYDISPMRYFPNSYLYTVAGVTYQNNQWVDNWLVSCTGRTDVEIKMNGVTQIVPICDNFCDGKFIPQDLASGDNFPVCNNEEWFASQLQNNKWVYPIVMPEVKDAIHDMIYRPQNEPVWLSAIYSVVPANRAPIVSGDTVVATVDGVGNFLNSSGVSCFTWDGNEVKLGNVKQTYIFNTPLGYLWKLTWKFYPSTCINPANPIPEVFYSEDIWDPVNGGFANIRSYPGSCENVDETLPQAYMRHLRETYGDNYNTSTFNRIMSGEAINLLTNQQVRFGMENRSVRMPVLGLEFYSEFPESETPTSEPITPTPLPSTYKISGIVWYTYNFNIPKETIIDQPTKSTIPATEFEFVVYDANQNLIQPLVCP